MNPSLVRQFEQIVEAGIELLPAPEIQTHFVFARDGCVVLVERRADGFGAVGSPGLLVEQGGFAALVERGGQTLFVWKGGESIASLSEAASARRLFTDLRTILG